ncbi:MAG: hypothetical protein HYV60_12130, partial [Planctomycetia bacterium]|nr:hypothetical protein [Planctomycetia bacterium]
QRQQLGDCLKTWKCPFQQVATVGKSLAAVKNANAAGVPFHVVLADCRLVTGNEFVELQELAAFPHLSVIGLGSPPDELSKEHLRGLGIRHVLHDPVRPSALFNALVSVLSVRNHQASREKDRSTQLQPRELKLTGHILVAEDNPINQLYIVELL